MIIRSSTALITISAVVLAASNQAETGRLLRPGTESGAEHPVVEAQAFDFPAQMPGGTLSGGHAAEVALSPCPSGVNGADHGHYLYIFDETGAGESVLITGGTCISGAATGTLVFTPSRYHDDAWSIQSATAGIQEALQAGGCSAQINLAPGTYVIRATIQPPFDRVLLSGAGLDRTTILAANGSNLDNMLLVPGRKAIDVAGIRWDANFINQTAGVGHGIQIYLSQNIQVQDCLIVRTGIGFPQQSSSYALLVLASSHIRIVSNKFMSNWGRDFGFIGEDRRNLYGDLTLVNNQFGTPNLTDSASNLNWWDTNSASHYAVGVLKASNVVVCGNRIYGAVKKPFLGNPLQVTDVDNVVVSDNLVDGLGNGTGSLSVVTGSGTVTGAYTYFKGGAPTRSDVNAVLMIEGDEQLYRISSVASEKIIEVTPAVMRSSASGLRYRISSTGDAIDVLGCRHAQVFGNFVQFSHDGGIDVGSDWQGIAGMDYSVWSNTSKSNIGVGLYVAGLRSSVIRANFLLDNGQAGYRVPVSHRAGLYIENSSPSSAVLGTTILENVMSDTQALPTQPYGLSIQGLVGEGNVLWMNRCTGNRKAPEFIAHRGFPGFFLRRRSRIERAFRRMPSTPISLADN